MDFITHTSLRDTCYLEIGATRAFNLAMAAIKVAKLCQIRT